MAINTDIGTMLYHSATGLATSFAKLVPVTSVPPTGSAPSKVEITALEDVKKKYRKGRDETPDMEFSFPYESANMSAVVAVTGDTHWFLVIYQDGSGSFIKGEAVVWVDAVGLDQMVVGKIGIIPEEIDYKTIAEVSALKSA